jgi:hypothetical protein
MVLSRASVQVLQDQSETPGGGLDTDDHLLAGVGRNLSIAALQSFFGPRIKVSDASLFGQ